MAQLLWNILGSRASDYVYVEFASGAGGPTPYIANFLNRQLRNEGKDEVKLVLSDLQPHLSAWEPLAKKNENISYISQSVDATNCPAPEILLKDVPGVEGKKVMRMFNLAFHHFDVDLAAKILENTVETSDGFWYVINLSMSLPQLTWHFTQYLRAPVATPLVLHPRLVDLAVNNALFTILLLQQPNPSDLHVSDSTCALRFGFRRLRLVTTNTHRRGGASAHEEQGGCQNTEEVEVQKRRVMPHQAGRISELDNMYKGGMSREGYNTPRKDDTKAARQILQKANHDCNKYGRLDFMTNPYVRALPYSFLTHPFYFRTSSSAPIPPDPFSLPVRTGPNQVSLSHASAFPGIYGNSLSDRTVLLGVSGGCNGLRGKDTGIVSFLAPVPCGS